MELRGIEPLTYSTTHILEKLGASNRTEATVRARRLGLLP